MAAPLAAQQSVPLILDDGSDLTSIFTELKITDVTYVGSDGWSFGGVTVSTLHHGGGCLQRLGQTGVLGGGEPCRPKHVAIPVPVTWRLTMQII